MFARSSLAVGILSFGLASAAGGSVVVNYTVDAGGNNNNPLNGLAARATFTTTGTTMTVLLENTSTGLPSGFQVGDAFLVSLGFNLPTGVNIVSGTSAVIGPGSIGLAQWSGRGPGDSVGGEWLWTNDFGGDEMEAGGAVASRQVFSTSNGQGGGLTFRFDGGSGTVNGPHGGIVSDPPQLALPGSSRGVSDGIVFTVTLSGLLTEDQLAAVAGGSVVEFGSDMQYLTVIPTPASLALLGAAGLIAVRRRR